MVQFISVPLKQTNEVDFITPLTSYINSLTEVSADLKNEVNEAIIELNKLRNRSCIQPLDKHQSSLDILTRYYDQLCAMDSKLPICPTQNPISFKWKDAFDKKSLFFSRASLTINDSSFERASVLFNCGAFMSVVAANHQINTDEELKAVAKLLQQSSGVFSKLKDCILGLLQQEPTSDLMPDTLSALSALMLAQAQEVFFVKVTRDHNKPTMLVKIAAQTAEFYQDAQKLMTRDPVKGIWPKEWVQIVSGKAFVYSALGQYHQSVIALTKKHIGEQISRLREAQRLFEVSANYLPSTFDYKIESSTVKKDLELAVNDNNYIYHETIPDFKTLSSLEKVPAAKVLPVVVPLTLKFRDLFENLIPVSIQNSLSLFESRKIDVINLETGCMREYTQILNACLASLNLPAALDDVKNHEKCPESIREKSSKVKSSGGIEFINSKLKDLPFLYKRNEEILDEIYRLLKEEKENDENLRIQFQEKWTRMPSDKLTMSLVQELGKYRGILHTATNADAIVQQKFDSNKKGIEILSKSESDLISSIPSLCTNETHKNSDTVQKLTDLMNKVQEIKVEREVLEKKLKEVKFDMSNDFLKSYTDNGVVNEEKISNDKIQELFQPLKIAVQKSIKLQETVLADIQTYNKRFCEERHSSGSNDRENVLKLLATAYDVFFSLKENILEGTKFYNDLTPILVRLQQKVSDFCFARKTEKDDLIKEVQQNILSNNNSNSAKSTAPPPRPPPPTSSQQASQPQQQWTQMQQITPATQMTTIPISQTYNTQQSQQNPAQIQQPGAFVPQTNPFVPYGMTPQPYQQQYQQTYQIPYPMQYPSTYPGSSYSTSSPYHYPSSGTYPQQQQYQYGAYPPQPQFSQQPQFPQQPQ